MYDAEVEREWDKVEFYEAKNSPKSVELYCNIIINKYPKSPYADMARKKLQEMNRDVAARGRTPGWWPGGEKSAEAPQSPPPAALLRLLLRRRSFPTSRPKRKPSPRNRGGSSSPTHSGGLPRLPTCSPPAATPRNLRWWRRRPARPRSMNRLPVSE